MNISSSRPCPLCAETISVEASVCRFCGERVPRVDAPVVIPGGSRKCSYCSEPIQPGARKCPHCREVLDPVLRQELNAEVQLNVSQAVEGQDVRDKALHSVIAASVGIVIMPVLGVVLGPIVLLYGLHYRNKALKVQIPVPGTVTALLVLSGIWTFVGVGLIALIVALAMSR